MVSKKIANSKFSKCWTFSPQANHTAILHRPIFPHVIQKGIHRQENKLTEKKRARKFTCEPQLRDIIPSSNAEGVSTWGGIPGDRFICLVTLAQGVSTWGGIPGDRFICLVTLVQGGSTRGSTPGDIHLPGYFSSRWVHMGRYTG